MLFKVTPFCKDCCQPVVAPGELQGLQIVWDVAPGAHTCLQATISPPTGPDVRGGLSAA